MKIPVSIPAETFKIRAIDMVVFFFILVILSFVIYIASQWSTPYDRTVEINLNPSNIPAYAIQSLARIFFQPIYFHYYFLYGMDIQLQEVSCMKR